MKANFHGSELGINGSEVYTYIYLQVTTTPLKRQVQMESKRQYLNIYRLVENFHKKS